MTEDDPFDLSVDELRGRDFTRVCARVSGVAVLSGDLGRGAEGVLDLEEVDRGRGNDDLCERTLAASANGDNESRLTSLAVEVGIV